ncbi:amidase family protein [Streptomyces sp. BH105]|uniref:amidase family protein n=1 Tax=Streptomyces sp. BH105 TaxID=3410408 RepID=UPI003CEA7D68
MRAAHDHRVRLHDWLRRKAEYGTGIARRLRLVQQSGPTAVRLTAAGTVAALSQAGALLTRHWWPVAAVASGRPQADGRPDQCGARHPEPLGHSVPAVLIRTVRDTAAVLDAVAAAGPVDVGHPLGLPAGGLLSVLRRDPGRLRIGVMTAAPTHAPPVTADVADTVRQTADQLVRLGHDVVDAHPEAMDDPACLPTFFDALSVTVVQTVDVLSRQIGPPGPGDLDPVTEFWLRRGRQITGVEPADALLWQGGFQARMSAWWESGFDLLLSPVFASPPKRVSWPWAEEDGIQASVDVLSFTAPFNTTGQPAISVPARLTPSGPPVGVQFAAAVGRKDLLIAVAGQLE